MFKTRKQKRKKIKIKSLIYNINFIHINVHISSVTHIGRLSFGLFGDHSLKNIRPRYAVHVTGRRLILRARDLCVTMMSISCRSQYQRMKTLKRI